MLIKKSGFGKKKSESNGGLFKNGAITKIKEKEKYNDDMIKILKMGSDMIKYKANGKKYKRHFYLDPDELTLKYSGSKKLFNSNKIVEIPEIQEIRNGSNTETFRKLVNRVQEGLSFSLIMGNKHQTLDLVAKTPEIKDQWVTALKHVISLYKNMEQEKEHERWAIEHFNRADVNKDGGLSFEETLQLLNHMNINMDKRYAKKLFDASDINTIKNKTGEDVLDQQEFLNFYKLLIRRPEILDIIREYSKTGSSFLEAKELLDFMQKEQKQTEITIDDCDNLIKTYEKTTKEGTLGVEGMRCMLVSRDQALFNKDHLEVYQDMTRPLSDYYINSSHNTYLGGDQIVGPCSIENYIKALRNGCRCVEIDVWDGQDGDPIVFHGHTLTPKIKFSEVINAISNYAFETSQFPVIISLENHCSIEQQKLMAHYLKAMLGDKIYVARIKIGDTLPSPNHIKEKFLIKGKKIHHDDQLVEDVSEEDEAGEMEDEIMENASQIKAPKTHQKIKLAKELSDLIYLRSVHFDGFDKPGKSNCIRSFEESKALTFVTEAKKAFIEYNHRNLTRIYPSGMRTDSSNFDPMPFWKSGCQIVAMNFQKEGKVIQLYQAKFRDNGNSGYVLKPDYLRSDYDEKTAQIMELRPKLLKIKIISAQQLPKPLSNPKDKDVIDPYVKISVIGLEHTQKSKTRIIENNGFNPVWNESFDFVIDDPQSAIIRFVVKDFDSTTEDDFIGQYTIPFNSLTEGYHHAHLRNKKSEGIPPATLFIHTLIEDYRDSFVSFNKNETEKENMHVELLPQPTSRSNRHSSLPIARNSLNQLPLDLTVNVIEGKLVDSTKSSVKVQKTGLHVPSSRNSLPITRNRHSHHHLFSKPSNVMDMQNDVDLITPKSSLNLSLWQLQQKKSLGKQLFFERDNYLATNMDMNIKQTQVEGLIDLENPYKPLCAPRLPNNTLIKPSPTANRNLNLAPGCTCHQICKTKIRKYPPNTIYLAPLIIDTIPRKDGISPKFEPSQIHDIVLKSILVSPDNMNSNPIGHSQSYETIKNYLNLQPYHGPNLKMSSNSLVNGYKNFIPYTPASYSDYGIEGENQLSSKPTSRSFMNFQCLDHMAHLDGRNVEMGNSEFCYLPLLTSTQLFGDARKLKCFTPTYCRLPSYHFPRCANYWQELVYDI